MVQSYTLSKYFRIFGRKCYRKRDDDVGKFDPRSNECIFLGYSLKRKAYRCFIHRTKTIVKCRNVHVDEKFGTKENMLDYNSNKEEDNTGILRKNFEVFFETNNDLQNDVQIVEQRGEQRSKPRDEIRVELATSSSNKNLTKNHPLEHIIGSKDKGVMTLEIELMRNYV